MRRRERASGSRPADRAPPTGRRRPHHMASGGQGGFGGPAGAERRRHHGDVSRPATRPRRPCAPRPRSPSSATAGSARRGLRTTTTSESIVSGADQSGRDPRPDGPQPGQDGPHSVQLVGGQLPPPTPLGRGTAVTPQPHDGRDHDGKAHAQSTSVARPSSPADASGPARNSRPETTVRTAGRAARVLAELPGWSSEAVHRRQPPGWS